MVRDVAVASEEPAHELLRCRRSVCAWGCCVSLALPEHTGGSRMSEPMRHYRFARTQREAGIAEGALPRRAFRVHAFFCGFGFGMVIAGMVIALGVAP